ncbi:MAG: hypothetical protein LCI00_16735 [Chloroflexi bacterium]|nr:hypothetical protein [Chloroflexota bacterium]
MTSVITYNPNATMTNPAPRIGVHVNLPSAERDADGWHVTVFGIRLAVYVVTLPRLDAAWWAAKRAQGTEQQTVAVEYKSA